MKTKKHTLIKVFVILMLIILLFNSCTKNKIVTNDITISNEEISKYIYSYQNKEGGFHYIEYLSNTDSLYNTYYAVKTLNKLNSDLCNKLIKELNNGFLSKPITDIINLSQTDYISSIYYYTELCKITKHYLTNKEIDFLFNAINKAKIQDGIYSYSDNYDSGELNINYLYSTEFAITSLYNIGKSIDTNSISSFVIKCIDNFLPNMDLYNKIFALSSIYRIYNIIDEDTSEIFNIIEKLINQNIEEIKMQFENKIIDPISAYEILNIFKIIDKNLISSTILKNYFREFIINDNFYGVAEDYADYLITFICISSLDSINFYDSNDKKNISEQLLEYKLDNKGFSSMNPYPPSLEETYFAYKTLEEIGINDEKVSIFIKNINPNSLNQVEYVYYLKLINELALKIPVPVYNNADEINNDIEYSFLNNPLEEDKHFYQMLYTLSTAEILKINLNDDRKEEIIDRLNQSSNDSLFQRILGFLIRYYLDPKKSSQIEERFFTLSSDIEEANIGEMDNQLLILYYYYKVIDLWNFQTNEFSHLSNNDSIDDYLSDIITEGGYSGSIQNIYDIVYVQKRMKEE